MANKYYIVGVTQDWLLKPGVVVYVEREYNGLVNRYISKQHHEISRWCEYLNLTFLYIPRFYESFEYDLMEYMTGQDLEYPSYDCTAKVLRCILPSSVVDQIKGPSLLFTGNEDNKLIAYQIEIPTEADEQLLNDIIQEILLSTNNTLNAIEKELFIDSDILFRGKEMDERMNKPSKEEFKCKNSSAAKFGTFLKKIIDEEEDSASSTRFRVANRPLEKEELDEEIEDIKNSEMFFAAQSMIRNLLDKGYSKELIWALFAPIQELSPIRITKDYRIFLTRYKKEIVLTPLLKAVYLFFLKHPEGVYFKDLPSYQAELLQLYRKFAIRGTAEKHVSTILDLVHPLSNSMNEKCSIIKKYMTNLLDDSLAKHYYISGSKGELKRIDIKPEMIVWE